MRCIRDPDKSCLDYVLCREKLHLLPAPKTDKGTLTSERTLLHKTCVEYLLSGGKGRDSLTTGQKIEAEALSKALNNLIGALSSSRSKLLSFTDCYSMETPQYERQETSSSTVLGHRMTIWRLTQETEKTMNISNGK